MKTLDNIKKVVITIGSLAMVIGFVGLFNSRSLIEQFFPLYTGFTLVGTVLLYKDKIKNVQS